MMSPGWTENHPAGVGLIGVKADGRRGDLAVAELDEAWDEAHRFHSVIRTLP
jgi:hypothetical protein